jgi:oxygen-independent coproporphyrinogen-3 oxidase
VTSTDPGFGVYIHWPFCAQKCPYCDFNSHVRHGGWDEDRFLRAYLRELDTVAGWTGERTLTSVFLGGGTPSLMKPATVAALLEHTARLWPVAPGAEITIEANPVSVEATRFAGYRAAGVNRVSMGLQSLRDEELKRLGRIHTAAEAKAALGIAFRTFERVSFDLIYARPGQTFEAWRQELSEALDLAGRHLSLYQLTIEPDTPFAALHKAGKLVIPDAEAAHDLYALTQELTESAGLPAYEISNHAAPGEESRHNLLYWRYGEYAGIGPGAHGRLRIGGVRHATATERSPETWASSVEEVGHGMKERTPLSRREQADEMLLMGLRITEGLDLERLQTIGGVRPSAGAISELQALGLLESSLPDTGDINEISGCVPPVGAGEWSDVVAESRCPATVAHSHRIRASREGRLILDALVRRLSESFEAV